MKAIMELKMGGENGGEKQTEKRKQHKYLMNGITLLWSRMEA